MKVQWVFCSYSTTNSKASGFPLTLSIFRGSFVEPASTTRWRFNESFAPILPPTPKHQGFPWLYPSFGGLNQLLLNQHLLDEGSVSLLLLFYYQLQSIRVSPDFIHLSGVFYWTSIYKMKVQRVFCSYSTTNSKASGFPLTLSIFRGSFVEPASTRWMFRESFAPILLPTPKHQGFPWLYPSFGGLLLNQHLLLDEGSKSLLLLFYYSAPKHQGFPWLYPSFGGLLLNQHLLDEGSVSLLLLFHYQLS